jgi:radical SAM protein with 4Fe4S-binding SPASM domain
MTASNSTSVSLPILNSNSGSSSSGGCKSCSHSADDRDQERLRKFEALQMEFHEAVLESRKKVDQENGSLAPIAATQRNSMNRVTVRANGQRELLSGEKAVYRLDPDSPLPLVKELSHHFVSQKNLWIGVLEGAVIALEDGAHELMELFRNEKSPAGAVEILRRKNNVDAEQAWDTVNRLIGRLATSGFIEGINGYMERRVPEPQRFARFHLTKACQLECIHCYADSSPHVDRSNEVSTERWMTLLEDFAANGGERVLYTGGEALIHKGCVELMRRSRDLGLHVTLFTNGILVPRHAQVIKETVDQVQVSLDGPDESTNDLVRGQGIYKKVVKALDIMLNQGTRVRVGMSVMEQNWESWRSGFLAFARRYANTDLEFRLGFGVTRYGRAADLSETLDVNETQPAVEEMLEKGNGSRGPRITRHTKGCGYGEQFVVGPDGTVYPCHLLDAPVAHIDERPLPQIIEMLKNVASLFDVDHTEGCSECDIRYLCGGTCRVMNGQRNGSRLITTCLQPDKERRYRNLVEFYS